MSKKGKIIFSSVLLLLIAAIIIVVITTTMNGGAKRRTTTQFYSYVENTQYYDFNNGKPKPTIEEGATVEIDGKTYKNVGGVLVTDDESKTPLIVIWKVNISSYEYLSLIHI